jgi:DNA-binding NtrC family response regulator
MGHASVLPQSANPSESAAALDPIVGRDPGLRAVVSRAALVAPTRVPVLIRGESGTGKELLARLIHRLGPAPAGPLVAVNCGTLPRELADSELFGHERGAFTGAGCRKPGWFEEAHGGTLVLDEIGEIPLDLQPKLLRVLETGRLRRVGGSGEIAVGVRIVALTLRDLRRETDRGSFRIDLYHRLAGFELELPPLRRRREDIPLLIDRILGELSSELGPHLIDGPAVAKLMGYDWPGNIRELRNVLWRAAILCPHRIGADVLELSQRDYGAPDVPHRFSPIEPLRLADGEGAVQGWPPGVPLVDARGKDLERIVVSHGSAADDATNREDRMTVEQMTGDLLPLAGRTFDQIERAVLGWSLRQHGGSRRRAARALAMPRSTLCDKVKRYGIT